LELQEVENTKESSKALVYSKNMLSLKPYVLQHMHGDHTKGLGSRWSRGPLYCSPITSRLLCVRFPGFDKRLLRPLEVGASTMVEVWNKQKLELMEVIAIDAHHCPGKTLLSLMLQAGTLLFHQQQGG
jgi:DNA cross-link repair 1B protein